jgi:hypothetical protein
MKIRNLFQRKKAHTRIQVLSIEFLGEQTGPVEDELKQRWTSYFRTELSISKAYLVRTRYDNSGAAHISLCIQATDHNHRQILKQTTDVFREMFNPSQSLDVIFLSSDEEQRVAGVCTPFYLQQPRQA